MKPQLLKKLETHTLSFVTFIYYRPQRSWAKVMFLQVCVILFTGRGVCLSACWDTTPQEQTPPRSRHPPPGADTPWEQTPPPQEQTPPRVADTPPEQSRLRHTVNERPVRILLECILVSNIFGRIAWNFAVSQRQFQGTINLNTFRELLFCLSMFCTVLFLGMDFTGPRTVAFTTFIYMWYGLLVKSNLYTNLLFQNIHLAFRLIKQ